MITLLAMRFGCGKLHDICSWHRRQGECRDMGQCWASYETLRVGGGCGASCVCAVCSAVALLTSLDTVEGFLPSPICLEVTASNTFPLQTETFGWRPAVFMQPHLKDTMPGKGKKLKRKHLVWAGYPATFQEWREKDVAGGGWCHQVKAPWATSTYCLPHQSGPPVCPPTCLLPLRLFLVPYFTEAFNTMELF